ncbi:nickel-dependent hydrogenase large subunit [Geobacter anodireducens]|uniref:Hydrogenase n=1 Tax=Geobacter soli TaxID=1510391 RepID=A0A0C1QLU2_9BACT|nr:nickel-dependent hydrogenase large subunit [Geobacter soli]KIE41572.1 hydrogenase [Geobacter soli]
MATQRVVIDPITRIEGHLRIELETSGGRITDAWASATQFRGIETILKGRDPRDAWALAQRICGVCTGIHAIASVRAVEDALDYPIPRQAELIRSLVTAMGIVQDHVMHFYHLHALDWVDVKSALAADPQAAARLAASVSPWPSNSAAWFREVQQRVGASVSGGQLGIFAGSYWGHPAYRLPPEANLLALAHYLEALQWQREIIRLHTIFGGKNPHPNFLVGGMACSINLDNQLGINAVRLDELTGLIGRARRFVEEVYYPDVLAIAGFYREYAAIGISSPTLMAVGEGAFSCAGTPVAGEVRAGVLADGDYEELRPFEPAKIAEFVTSSWYAYPEGDNAGRHPWRGETAPRYTGPRPPYGQISDNVKYTWVKAPRYDGRAVQVGPNARMLVACAQGHKDATRLTDEALAGLGAGREALNSTLGRTLCRAVESVLLCNRMDEWFRQFQERIHAGDTTTFNPDKWDPATWPKSAQGVGFTEAARGTLSHWVEIENGRITRYQCVVPSTWNSSGRDASGQPGPFEHALAHRGHHPLLEPGRPLEVLRTIHSFDPCQSCAVHLFDPAGGTIGTVSVS